MTSASTTPDSARFDLLIRGGTVIDPAQNLHARRDLAIRDGHIAALDESIPADRATQVIDATGLLVTPGLVDLHTHIYHRVVFSSIDPSPLAARSGTTTMVDCGSAGAATLDGFRHYVANTAACRVLAFLNISVIGLAAIPECGYGRFVDANRAFETADANRDLVVGIKVRGSRMAFDEDNTAQPVHMAKAAARDANLPLMLHLGDPPPTVEQSIPLLDGGDFVTHSYKGKPVTRLVDHAMRAKSILRDARERGVLIDVGHGSGSFSWPVAHALCEQGYWPDTISTDAHHGVVEPPIEATMPNVMSKFLHLGMPLDDVIRASTLRPAQSIGRADRIGSLEVGRTADVALLALEEGSFPLADSSKQPETASRRLVARHTIYAGRLLDPAGTDRPPPIGHRSQSAP